MGFHPQLQLPPPEELRCAVRLYLDIAFDAPPPPATARFCMSQADGDVAAFLMGEHVERDPADAPIENVRSFAMRIGNTFYPHMKLRIAKPPNDLCFIYSVDSHDAFLRANPGTPDYSMLEELKKHNAAVTAKVLAAWDAAGLTTERNYLRKKIDQARDSQGRPATSTVAKTSTTEL